MAGRPPLVPPQIDFTAPPLDVQTEFRAGVTAVLRRWSALRAAVESSWGGITSHAKAEALRQYLFTTFNGRIRHPTTVNELEDYIDTYMEDEFSVILEDGSVSDIADIICEMYQKCFLRDVDLARKMVHLAEVEAGNRPRGPVAVVSEGDIDEDSDDEMDDDDEGDNDNGENPSLVGIGSSSLRSSRAEASATANEVAQAYISGELFGGGPTASRTRSLGPQRQLGEKEPDKVKDDDMMDDDGFITVTRSRK
mmetsp:Transcript_40570/g.95264  ORF Transcript_40570/g.95264 Transcript_40570/m.95264 type:complete len:252 (-) Transcript_40570:45-800(-)